MDNDYEDNSRVIPIPRVRISSRSLPPKVDSLIKNDITAVELIARELRASGIIEREVIIKDKQSIDEINELMDEAVSLAKSEKELNPNSYDPDLDEAMRLKESRMVEDWDNPSLDGIDDYGVQYYENELEKENLVPKVKKTKEIDAKVVKVRLSDGTVVKGQVLGQQQ